CVQGTHLFTF
nr:immunoglobulin light chain junction region [Macaca mulatta]MOV62921.1 immunoglobulin light chain junction region [Macaca mulatta]MOV65137.1 immunoglobulin light chain junction region [Macaca mulatta]